MAREFIDYSVDIRNSDAPDYIHIQTDYYSGSEDDFTAPAAANFPNATPTRYFLKIPWIIDVSDLSGARPFLMRDVTDGVTLTPTSGAPGVNQYFLPPSDSSARGTIELNSGQAGHAIGLDFYSLGGILTASETNDIDRTGIVTGEGGVYPELAITRNTGGVESTVTTRTKILTMGDWNMDTTIAITVTHGISDYTKIRSMTAVIIPDDETALTMLAFIGDATGTEGGGMTVGSTVINVNRFTGGFFDNSGYDSTSFNRGFIRVVYDD